MNHVPKAMAAWTKSRDEVGGFSIEQHPVPVPAAGEVLIKTKSTSICGTDLHIWKWDEWSRENVPLGTVTGHETCGEVVALGGGVNTHAIGDIVARIIETPTMMSWIRVSNIQLIQKRICRICTHSSCSVQHTSSRSI